MDYFLLKNKNPNPNQPANQKTKQNKIKAEPN